MSLLWNAKSLSECIQILVAPIDYGHYSKDKFARYENYVKQPLGNCKLLMISLLLPIPALLSTTLILNLPLVSPLEGIVANYMNFIQLFIGTFGCGIALAEILSSMIPELEMQWKHYLMMAFSFALSLALSILCFSIGIGYPVPFAMTYPVVFTVPFTGFTTYWIAKDKMKDIPKFQSRLRSFLLFIVILTNLIVIYPALTILTIHLQNSTYGILIVACFPLIKYCFRNLVYVVLRPNDQSSDLACSLGTMGIDFYSALYVANLVQSGVNMTIMSALLTLDIFINVFRWWRIRRIIRRSVDKGINRHVWHRIELMVLSEYVESIVPMIYMVFSWLSYTSINREYIFGYGEKDISLDEMITNSGYLVALAFLEGGTLAGLLWILAWSEKIPMRLIFGFCMKEHWYLMAGIMLTMMSNLTGFQMVHYGTDFTFQFAWLHNN